MRPEARLHAYLRHLPDLLPRNGEPRRNSGGEKSLLVTRSMHYDLLARIKNAVRARKESFLAPFSKFDLEIAQLLVAAGYLQEAQKKTLNKKQCLEVKLLYRGSEPAFTDFRVMSKPGRRLYVGYRDMKPVKQGYGVGVFSTPVGVLSNRDARKQKVGGEYLFEVW